MNMALRRISRIDYSANGHMLSGRAIAELMGAHERFERIEGKRRSLLSYREKYGPDRLQWFSQELEKRSEGARKAQRQLLESYGHALLEANPASAQIKGIARIDAGILYILGDSSMELQESRTVRNAIAFFGSIGAISAIGAFGWQGWLGVLAATASAFTVLAIVAKTIKHPPAKLQKMAGELADSLFKDGRQMVSP